MNPEQDTAEAPAVGRWHPRRLRAAAIRIPFTLSLFAVMFFMAITTAALWEPIHERRFFPAIAYGLPSFEKGHWWTLLTGMLWEPRPAMYIGLIILIPVSVMWLELRRGSAVAARYFIFGQIAAVLLCALFLALVSGVDWVWADKLANGLAVGPGPGLFACLAGAVNSLREPWRRRGRLILLYVMVVSVLFVGALVNVLNAAAIGLILLLGMRHQPRAASVHERRFTSFVSILALGAMQLILTVVQTSGPFGTTELFDGAWPHALINAAIILVLANGLRVGRRLAWVLTLLLVIFNILAGAIVFGILQIDLPELEEVTAFVSGSTVTIANAVLWCVFLVYLLVARGAFTVPIRRRLPGVAGGPEESVRTLLRREGGGDMSWMATWPDNRHFFSASGRSMLAYQVHAKTAIVLADPVGPAEERTAVCEQFIAASERAGFVPCFFVASDALRAESLPQWRSLQVAEDTIIDLPGLAFTGKRWNSVRTSINKAEREGITFRLTHLSTEPRRVQQQVRAISEAWLGDKGLPEMGFTLGGVDEALDPDVRLALAYNAEGEIDGFLSWLPVFAPGGEIHGWTLDLMRRREGGFGPVMEYLIGSSARDFSAEGAQIASLSGAPLANIGQPGATLIDSLVNGLGEAIEPLYGFRSLHAFKRKFNPRYEPVFLLYRDEGDLARIGIGLSRAFLPNASLASLARGLRHDLHETNA
ncbi:bifunctional lysylphosphatidylglycerol flippase/synthetase MprF [Mycetocola spongiae]|uniref:bifunctional lysylphosphatidylglycerol flippase/synthetase MprF n=1 Tax=Mycetocola spongiae TaxID=2859226 RepID=UPI001CF31FC0|nr:DUF2156 domain-containing protein [Mycetocola spongiae]UCR88259.1 DUF2156 domain-containing protein [Mycetocola spongiae]